MQICGNKYFGFKSVFFCTVYSVIAALQHTPLYAAAARQQQWRGADKQ